MSTPPQGVQPQDWSNIPPELIAQILSGQTALPTYSAKAQGYLPPDAAWQAKNLNFMQDAQKSLWDPQFASMAGPAAYDANALQQALMEYQAPVTAGSDYLKNIVAKSPGTPRAFVAQGILDGLDPERALVQAQQVSKAQGFEWPTDAKTKATSKDMMDFAQTAWEKAMTDTPGQGTNDPYAKAGFTDPSARFTPEMMNSKLPKLDEHAKAAWLAKQAADRQAADATSQLMARATDPNSMRAKHINPDRMASSGPSMADQIAAQQAALLPAGMQFTPVNPNSAPNHASFTSIGGPTHHDVHQAQVNPIFQAQVQGNQGNFKAANDAWLAHQRANRDAAESTQAYGSPFLMQMMARQNALRAAGVLQ